MAEIDLLDQFSSSLVKEKVDIIEFAESDRYCNMTLYPRQATLLKLIFLQDLNSYDEAVVEEWINSSEKGGEVFIVPKLEDRIRYLRSEGYPHFRLVQLVGGRRSSKGFLTGMSIAYKAYQLTQLDNAALHFSIPKGKDIYLSVVADSLDQAKAHQFGDAANAIMECRPLVDQKLIGRVIAESVSVYTPYDKRRMANLAGSGVRVDRDLASIKIKAFGTNAKTLRGSASIMYVFDEMAHLIAGESRQSDEEIYQAAIPSLAQFRKDAMVFANSSPYTKTGQFYKLYEQALKLDEITDLPMFPAQFMIQFPSWELYKDFHKNERTAFMGKQVSPPEEDPQIAFEEKSDPESFKVEYRAQFAEVANSFLRPEMVDRMFDPDWNMKILGRKLTPAAGAIGFTRYKGHGDPASVGANFGIAVGHVEDIENPETGIKEQHVVFDLIDAFYPEDFDQHTIDWLEVVPTIASLINNFRPFEFTFDQFDSRMAIEVLERQMKNLGVGETQIYMKPATQALNMQRAKNFKAALNLGRVHAAHPKEFNPIATKNAIELCKLELKFLEEKNGKIDKQTIGPVQTKDIADCVMEVTDALIGNTLSYSLANLEDGPSFGAPGGYGIGLGNTETFGEFGDWYPRGSRSGVPSYMPQRGIDRHNDRYTR